MEFYKPSYPDFRNSPLFYVYVHFTIDDGSIFYVGKGRGERYKSYKKRSDWWVNKARKHGVYPEVLWMFNNEVCALSMEVALIKFIGKNLLVNITDGGDGVSGMKKSEAQKLHLSEMKKKLWRDPEYRKEQSERVIGSKNPMYGKHGPNHPSFGKTSKLKGVKRPDHSALMSGSNHPNHDPSIHEFIHRDGRIEKCTKLEMRLKYGLQSTCLSKLCAGKSNHVAGWRLSNGI